MTSDSSIDQRVPVRAKTVHFSDDNARWSRTCILSLVGHGLVFLVLAGLEPRARPSAVLIASIDLIDIIEQVPAVSPVPEPTPTAIPVPQATAPVQPPVEEPVVRARVETTRSRKPAAPASPEPSPVPAIAAAQPSNSVLESMDKAGNASDLPASATSQPPQGALPSSGVGLTAAGKGPTKAAATAAIAKPNSGGEGANWRAYGIGIHRAVAAAREYPFAARRLGLEGVAKIEIAVNGRGQLLGKPKLVASSGHDVLDQAALAAVGKAAPFPALAAAGAADSQKFVIPIQFKLTAL